MSAPAHQISNIAQRPSPGSTPVTAVRRLRLTDFRSYRSVALDVEAAPVVLVGPNGAGKTNLLEALSFLAPGRGLRRARLSAVGHRAGEAREDDAPENDSGAAWAVAADIATDDGVPVRIGTGLERDGAAGSERRVVRIDGAAVRGQQPLAEHLAVAWLTPELDRLFMDGASGRRRFLDRLLTAYDPAHTGRIAAYEHVMRERNRLLQAGNADPAWLGALEDRMAQNGIAIAVARRDFVDRLAAALEGGSGRFPAPDIAVDGALETWLEEGSALQVEDRVREALAAGRRRDAEVGGAAIGPHRSDLAARQRGSARPAAECSTGEQKGMVLALTLAHARLIAADRGATPVMLWDEIAAHLDAGRRADLFDDILALGGQSWLSGADRALFDPLAGRCQFLAVTPGAVTRS